MLDPSLFSYDSHIDARTIRARVLLVTLGSFADAGHAQRLLDDHMLNNLTNHRIGAFDTDQVISYREQRPSIVFNSDHFSQYRAPSLVLHEVTAVSYTHLDVYKRQCLVGSLPFGVRGSCCGMPTIEPSSLRTPDTPGSILVWHCSG